MNNMAMNQLWATQQAKLEEKDAEIERLKALLARAAEALEAARGFDFIAREVLEANGITENLIAKLRKAAE
jgi:hypothetical protein